MNWIKKLTSKKEFDCNDVKENCSDYVDQEMPGETTAKFESHVDDCPDCGTFVKTFRATVMTIRDLPSKAPRDGLKQRIQQRITDDSATK
jgi:anti-sigma factor RsiW